MTPATLAAAADYKLLKFLLDEEDDYSLKVVEAGDVCEPEAPPKSVKPQQLVAGMAFRLFGLDVMPVYKANNGFTRGVDYAADEFTEISFNGYPNTIMHAAQVLREFAQNDGVAEHGDIKKNNVSEYLSDLFTNEDDDDVVCFSKIKDNREIIIIYNTSEADAKERFILLDDVANCSVKKLEIIYGYDACGHMHLFHGRHNERDISYAKIYLKPLHLVILKNY